MNLIIELVDFWQQVALAGRWSVTSVCPGVSSVHPCLKHPWQSDGLEGELPIDIDQWHDVVMSFGANFCHCLGPI